MKASRTAPEYSQAIKTRIYKPSFLIELAFSAFAKVNDHLILHLYGYIGANA
jgi:hypothetical protein